MADLPALEERDVGAPATELLARTAAHILQLGLAYFDFLPLGFRDYEGTAAKILRFVQLFVRLFFVSQNKSPLELKLDGVLIVPRIRQG